MGLSLRLERFIPKFYGPSGMREGTVRFTTVNGAAPTVTEALGIVAVTRTGEGAWDIEYAPAAKDVTVTGLTVQAASIAALPVVTAVNTTTRKVSVSLITIADGTTASDAPGAILHVSLRFRMSS